MLHSVFHKIKLLFIKYHKALKKKTKQIQILLNIKKIYISKYLYKCINIY